MWGMELTHKGNKPIDTLSMGVIQSAEDLSWLSYKIAKYWIQAWCLVYGPCVYCISIDWFQLFWYCAKTGKRTDEEKHSILVALHRTADQIFPNSSAPNEHTKKNQPWLCVLSHNWQSFIPQYRHGFFNLISGECYKCYAAKRWKKACSHC